LDNHWLFSQLRVAACHTRSSIIEDIVLLPLDERGFWISSGLGPKPFERAEIRRKPPLEGAVGPVYPNLVGELELTGLNQLWVADITYIRLELEFVYLAVVLDAYSRRVIGWALERSLEDELTLAALRMALRERQPASGLMHHSDRGVQYASGDYTGLLKEHRIRISISRKGNPYDNATCESFMKTLKYDEVYRQEYRDLGEARSCIQQFLEKVYNQKRLHSALGYCSPVKFEQSLSAAAAVGASA